MNRRNRERREFSRIVERQRSEMTSELLTKERLRRHLEHLFYETKETIQDVVRDEFRLSADSPAPEVEFRLKTAHASPRVENWAVRNGYLGGSGTSPILSSIITIHVSDYTPGPNGKPTMMRFDALSLAVERVVNYIRYGLDIEVRDLSHCEVVFRYDSGRNRTVKSPSLYLPQRSGNIVYEAVSMNAFVDDAEEE